MKPDEIADRKYGSFYHDRFAIELTMEMRENLTSHFHAKKKGETK